MTRNLKALGLALVAAFAMAVVTASTASAVDEVTAGKGVLTSTGPVTLIGKETGVGNANALTAFGSSVRCPGSTYTGHTADATPHVSISKPTSHITLTPHYNNVTCEATTALGLKKATVNMNGCDYTLTAGETTGVGDTYGVTADICPGSAGPIKVTVYNSAPGHTSSESEIVCNITVKPQSVSGAHITDTTNGHLDLTGTFTGLHVERTGICVLDGKGSTTATGEFHVDASVEGRNSLGQTTAISVTHT